MLLRLRRRSSSDELGEELELELELELEEDDGDLLLLFFDLDFLLVLDFLGVLPEGVLIGVSKNGMLSNLGVVIPAALVDATAFLLDGEADFCSAALSVGGATSSLAEDSLLLLLRDSHNSTLSSFDRRVMCCVKSF